MEVDMLTHRTDSPIETFEARTLDDLARINKKYLPAVQNDGTSEVINKVIDNELNDRTRKLFAELLGHQEDFRELIQAYKINHDSFWHIKAFKKNDEDDYRLLIRIESLLTDGIDHMIPPFQNYDLTIRSNIRYMSYMNKIKHGKYSAILDDVKYMDFEKNNVLFFTMGGITMVFPELDARDCSRLMLFSQYGSEIKCDNVISQYNLEDWIIRMGISRKEDILKSSVSIPEEFQEKYSQLAEKLEKKREYDQKHIQEITGMEYTDFSGLGK